jgi:hypothetical protein
VSGAATGGGANVHVPPLPKLNQHGSVQARSSRLKPRVQLVDGVDGFVSLFAAGAASDFDSDFDSDFVSVFESVFDSDFVSVFVDVSVLLPLLSSDFLAVALDEE